MTFAQARRRLHALSVRAVLPGLHRTHRLLAGLKRPDRSFPAAHITGTNGKGSVAGMLASVLSAAGYTVGRFTSPHLAEERERITINGRMISQKAFARAVQHLLPGLRQLKQEGNPATTFEAWTALAAEAFHQAGADIAVVEVGMGGRLDATTAWERALVTMLTNVELEHTSQLGRTRKAICREKMGIGRTGIPMLAAEPDPALRREMKVIALQKRFPLFFSGSGNRDDMRIVRREATRSGWKLTCRSRRRTYARLALPLAGAFQVDNAALVLLALEQLAGRGFAISLQNLRQGLGKVHMPGRLETVGRKPGIVFDGAHNPAAVWAATQKWREAKEELTLVVGIMQDKDIKTMCRYLLPVAGNIVTVKPPDPRGLPARDLARHFHQLGKNAFPARSYRQALAQALASTPRQGGILVLGSLYNIQPARQALKNLRGSV
ncbi:hypothetical protein JW933_06740 [candidate division FCPU426 bacterium]|nr:hypothetical protein [candidate division FCPU426 bacterium]